MYTNYELYFKVHYVVLGNTFECECKWTCIALVPLQSTERSKLFATLVTLSRSHIHSYTDGRGCHARCQLTLADVQLGVPGIRTSDLPNSRRAAAAPKKRKIFTDLFFFSA